MFTVQGCGHTISPSGNTMSNQVDPGHFIRIVTPIDWQNHRLGTSVLYYPQDRNAWSVDKADPQLACRIFEIVSSDRMVETVGVGSATYGNSFSVNSDKWECLLSGWSPGGREGGNGRNMVLMNYTDKISFNVSRALRRDGGSASDQVTPHCVKTTQWQLGEATSFFVSGPREDILPELRTDAETDYSVPRRQHAVPRTDRDGADPCQRTAHDAGGGSEQARQSQLRGTPRQCPAS
jgi:hypothetical protein